VRERAREVHDADVLQGVVADVEVRELREGLDVVCERDGAARLHRVPAEVERVERRAEVQAGGDGGDAVATGVGGLAQGGNGGNGGGISGGDGGTGGSASAPDGTPIPGQNGTST
jgi:hypothetical protein